MDLSALSLDFSSVLVMGLMVVSAYAGIWAVRKVISLACDDYWTGYTAADNARDLYKNREALYADGWTDAEYRIGVKDSF